MTRFSPLNVHNEKVLEDTALRRQKYKYATMTHIQKRMPLEYTIQMPLEILVQKNSPSGSCNSKPSMKLMPHICPRTYHEWYCSAPFKSPKKCIRKKYTVYTLKTTWTVSRALSKDWVAVTATHRCCWTYQRNPTYLKYFRLNTANFKKRRLTE